MAVFPQETLIKSVIVMGGLQPRAWRDGAIQKWLILRTGWIAALRTP